MAYPDWLNSLHTNITTDFVSPLPAKFKEEITFTVRIAKGHALKEIHLRCAPEGSGRFWPLSLSHSDAYFDYYRLTFIMRWKQFNYRFMIRTESEVYWFNTQGISQYETIEYHDFKLRTEPGLANWVHEKVFYQIFPDRFYNGNPARDKIDGTVTQTGETLTVKKWGDKPEGGFDFFNGDLEGIILKLDHLERLGVNGIYLNPIYLAPSNHRYDFLDYCAIDPGVGDDAVFAQLCDDLHDRGWHMMLDGVFNHTGAAHNWFNKMGLFDEPGAYQKEASPYDDFYTFHAHPHSYVGWWDHDSLPKLDYRSEKLREEIYRKDDSVIKYWLKAPFKIDAWRFDVANMQARYEDYQQGLEVWREIREAVRPDYPDVYLMGEHFYDGSELCQGDALDGQMNYKGFYYPILNWLSGKFDFNNNGTFEFVPVNNFNATAFVEQVSHFMQQVPFQNALQMYNLLNSHDRDRFITLLDCDKVKLRTAMIFLFTYVGVPSVYYGDEIGLEGKQDPDCRRTMPWDEKDWDMALFEDYQSLIQIRLEHPALQTGSIQWLYSGNNVCVFSRFLANETLLVVLSKDQNNDAVSFDITKAGLEGKRIQRLYGKGKAKVEGHECITDSHSSIYKIS